MTASGAEAGTAFAVGATPVAPSEIAVTTAAVAGMLGVDLTAPQMRDALQALGFAVRAGDGAIGEATTTLLVTPPYWRNDVALTADVIEEIARVIGYDRIVPVQPSVSGQTMPPGDYARDRRIANALASLGYREVMTIPLQPHAVYERFVAAGVAPPSEPVQITNPLSEDQRYLRFSLLPGLLALAARHAGDRPLRLFEIGHTFERNGAANEPDFEIASDGVDARDERPGRTGLARLGFSGIQGRVGLARPRDHGLRSRNGHGRVGGATPR